MLFGIFSLFGKFWYIFFILSVGSIWLLSMGKDNRNGIIASVTASAVWSVTCLIITFNGILPNFYDPKAPLPTTPANYLAGSVFVLLMGVIGYLCALWSSLDDVHSSTGMGVSLASSLILGIFIEHLF